MSCGTSDPLPQVAPAETKNTNKQHAETGPGTTSAMEVDGISEVKAIGPSNIGVDEVLIVETNGHADAPGKIDTADAVHDSLSGAMPERSAVNELVTIDSKRDSEKPQGQQSETNKMDIAPTSTQKKIEVDGASDKDELEDMQSDTTEEDEVPLLFRCISCKRCAHYQHRTSSDFVICDQHG